MSLFPIGSYIELSDGRVGRVLRSNGELYHQPIVEVWQPTQPQQPQIVDLAAEDALRVVKPLACLPQKAPAGQPLCPAADFETSW